VQATNELGDKKPAFLYTMGMGNRTAGRWTSKPAFCLDSVNNRLNWRKVRIAVIFYLILIAFLKPLKGGSPVIIFASSLSAVASINASAMPKSLLVCRILEWKRPACLEICSSNFIILELLKACRMLPQHHGFLLRFC